MRILSIDPGIKNMGICVARLSNSELTVEKLIRTSIFRDPGPCETCGRPNSIWVPEDTENGQEVFYCMACSRARGNTVKCLSRRSFVGHAGLSGGIYRCLESLVLSSGEIDEAIIEEQPPMANKRLRDLSCFIFFYLKEVSRIPKVSFVSPRTKFKGLPHVQDYKRRKEIVVEAVEEMLGPIGGSKKDDICDAFMLCIRHLEGKYLSLG